MNKKTTAQLVPVFLLITLLASGCGEKTVHKEEKKTVNEGITSSSASAFITTEVSSEITAESSADNESLNDTSSEEELNIAETAETINTPTDKTDLSADQDLTEQESQNEIEIEIRNWMDSMQDACEREDTEALCACFDSVYSVDDAYQNAWELQKLDSDYTIEAREVEDGIIAFLQGALKDSGEETGVYLSFCRKEGKLIFDYSIISNHICRNCRGAGQIYHGGQPCGICGGTGQVWVDNMYYDGILWQGDWQTCGGCGGVGYTGAISATCGVCGGTGIRLNSSP